MGRAKPCLFLILLAIIILQNSTIAMKPKGFTLRMIHRESEESPLYNPLDHLMTPEERFQTLIDQSRARARHIASRINPDVYAPVVYENSYYYAASVGIGTFPGLPGGVRNYYLLIDSGSDITWLQCLGATQVFRQESPLYPWMQSTSYVPMRCEDPTPECPSCNLEGQCADTISYEISQTYVVFGHEIFTVPSTTIMGTERFQMIMGCGLYQSNFTFGNGGRNAIAGILGLGRGQNSFINQLGPHGGGKFSYCLEQHRGRRMVGNTFLSFGADARIEGRRQVIRTPIVQTIFQTHFYYLNLEAISVAGAMVRIPRRLLQINNDRTGGCVIDSGSPFTTMYGNIFDKVAAAVDLYFRPFRMHRAGFSVIHQACYIPVPGMEYSTPSISYHFQQGAEFFVPGDHTWYEMEGKICLAITRSDSNMPAVVIGAIQQIDKRILYNVGQMSLSFADEDCGRRRPRG